MPALVIGSMVPDLPLFMWWPRGYDISHSLHGIVTLDVGLTVGVLLLWVFAVRDAVVDMAPEAVRLRLPERARLTAREWLLAPVAGCIGVTTHVVWDAFTHEQRWGTRHVAWLSTEHAGLPGQRWMQYVTGVLALAVVGWVVLRHLRSMPLELDRRPAVLPPFVLPGVLVAGALVGMVSAVLQWPDGRYEMAFCAVVNGVSTVLLLGLLTCVAWQILARRRSQTPTTRWTATHHATATVDRTSGPPVGEGRPIPPRVAAASSWSRVIARDHAPRVIRTLDIMAKVVLLLLLGLALIYPDMGHMEDKASGLRAVTYPMLAFTLPAIWLLCRRDREAFPWGADLMVTMTLFTDIVGNRMNLFDTVGWFDDWVHVMNPGLLTAAVILVTMPHTATLGATVERALAFGMTAAVAWEVAEYLAFISRSTEKQSAYSDTLGDLALGAVGALVAALIIHRWRARSWVPATGLGPSSACVLRGDGWTRDRPADIR
jgi:hypothetical protein